MNNKNVLIYPYDSDYEIFLKYSALKNSLKFSFLIYGYEIRNHNHKYNKYIIHELSKEVIENTDYIYITESAEKLSIDMIFSVLKNFVNKKVIVSNKYYCKPDIIDFCENNHIKVTEVDELKKFLQIIDVSNLNGKKLYKCNVPIISILGLSPNTQKFELQLYLRQAFLSKGYRVGQIGSRHGCEILGFHSYPNFMTDKNYTEVEKIYLYNNFIKEIELKENPDVIIISSPNAVMPLSDRQHFNFGMDAYEICNAVKSDFVIMATPNGEYNDDFYKEISIVCKYKHNIAIDMFFISDYVAISQSLEDEQVAFSKIDTKNNKSKYFYVCNSKDIDQSDTLANIVEDTLLDYNSVVQF